MKKFPIILTLLIFIVAVSSASAADISAFELKGGRVFKGGEEIECYVNEVPSEIEGPVRYWISLGWQNEVREDEYGAYFFTSEGACLTFVPDESCQDVIFSPDGGRFVLVTGSGFRPDMYFEVYGEGTEKTAEFSGIRGQLEWIDPVRFVFTRIDDIREAGAFLNLSYGLRFSVAMYDTATGETTVLKEATDTQNFWCPEVIEDGSAVAVTEDSVKSEKDWDDEEKIERREIRVEIPPAG